MDGGANPICRFALRVSINTPSYLACRPGSAARID